jgi:cellulose synthase (UDP-forming)
LPAWFTQQFKWARGVFEVLLTQFPRLWPHLTWAQRLAYGVRMTYYWIGPVFAIHLLIGFLVLLSGNQSAQNDFAQYVVALSPLALLVLFIRHMALRSWRHPSVVVTLLWRAIVLIYATWPFYALAWLMAILRVPLQFRPTPKDATGALKLEWLLPQAAAILLLSCALPYSILYARTEPLLALILFVAFQVGLQLLLLGQWLGSIASAYTTRKSTSLAPPVSELSEAPVHLQALKGNKAEYD